MNQRNDSQLELQFETTDFFPSGILPDKLNHELVEHANAFHYSYEYLAASVIAVTASMCGKGLIIQDSYTGISTVFIVLVGDSGTGKTPAMRTILAPVSKLESEKLKRYCDTYQGTEDYDYHEHAGLQHIVTNTTVEGLIQSAKKNKHGILIYSGELLSWFKSFGQYKPGANGDMQQWLLIYDGDAINVVRAGKPFERIEAPRVSVLGGIQPGVMNQLYKGGTEVNGFIPRLLFVNPADERIMQLPDQQHRLEIWPQFVERLDKIFDGANLVAKLPNEARKKYKEYDNAITHEMANTDDSRYREYLSKQKIYFLRFVCILHALDCAEADDFIPEVRPEIVENAYKLIQYFTGQYLELKSEKESMESISINKVLHAQIMIDICEGLSFREIQSKYHSQGFTYRALRALHSQFHNHSGRKAIATQYKHELANLNAISARNKTVNPSGRNPAQEAEARRKLEALGLI